MKKFIPVIVIASAFLLAFLLGAKDITFDDFISNRDQILMFRDSNLTFSVMIFMLIYISVVTFSIPGATVLSVTGGFIFGQNVTTGMKYTLTAHNTEGVDEKEIIIN